MSYWFMPECGIYEFDDGQEIHTLLRSTYTGDYLSPDEAAAVIRKLVQSYEWADPEFFERHTDLVAMDLSTTSPFQAGYMASNPCRGGYAIPKRTEQAHVYVMQADDLYKIGVSENPEKRRKSVASTVKKPVELVYSREVRNPYRLEHWLHERFTHCHIHGEWFRLIRFDLDHVKCLIDQWTGDEEEVEA